MSDAKLITLAVLVLVVLGGGGVAGCMAGMPRYKVWQQQLEGEAELAKAEYTKKVLVQDAIARKESAQALAEAEVIRARGVAQANQIIGQSLQGNEAYLRYLWIQSLTEGRNEVIYVPTEANLPILEATRLAPAPKPAAAGGDR